PRTAQAWPCTTRRGSARSVCANASPDTTTSGATPSCWNVDARTESSIPTWWPAPTDPAARTPDPVIIHTCQPLREVLTAESDRTRCLHRFAVCTVFRRTRHGRVGPGVSVQRVVGMPNLWSADGFALGQWPAVVSVPSRLRQFPAARIGSGGESPCSGGPGAGHACRMVSRQRSVRHPPAFTQGRHHGRGCQESGRSYGPKTPKARTRVTSSSHLDR